MAPTGAGSIAGLSLIRSMPSSTRGATASQNRAIGTTNADSTSPTRATARAGRRQKASRVASMAPSSRATRMAGPVR